MADDRCRGEAGEGQAPPRTPAAIWAAGGEPGRAPETRLGPGQPLTRAGSQSGGWGVWLEEPPLTPPAWSMDAAGAGTGQDTGGWGGQEGSEGRASLVLDRACSSETSLEPPLQKGKAEGRPGSSRVGGGLGDHAAEVQRLRGIDGRARSAGRRGGMCSMGWWIPLGVPHELRSHAAPGTDARA